MEELIKQIMAIDNLDDLNKVQKAIKLRRESLGYVQAHSWKAGQKVQMVSECWSRKPNDTVGSIVKLNPKKIQVDFGKHGIWNVPRDLLQAV
jgi:hypothetical protein